jgi:sulfhydrogenase subunit alpha
VTHRAPPSHTLRVDALTRVEGEGAMVVEVEGGEVRDVQLRIYEPPRFFEAFLRGRGHTEPPDITARICGICPVAYQMSACAAIEDACGVTVDPGVRALRMLLYLGEWIESHTLHVYLLHAPDFLGVDSAIELAERDRPTVERGLRLKKVGNHVLEVLGGRAVHPVNVKVGGFWRAPTRAELRPLREELLLARDDALATVAWVAGFEFPDHGEPHVDLALRHPDEYGILDGRIVSSEGHDLAPSAFEDQVVEEHVPHSNALHARLLDGRHYRVGPLARFNHNHDRLAAVATEAAATAGLVAPVHNPFRSIVVRAVEVLHACDRAVALVEDYEPPEPAAVPVPPSAAVGHGATEAPRGLLYHRYALDHDGTIEDAVIVPPTSQNQAVIEHDLWHVVDDHLRANGGTLDTDALTHTCEQAIRNHDPCISCATHFLDLRVVGR